MSMDPREALVATAREVAARGLTHGSTGNISLRVGDDVLVTPTGSALATVRPEDLALVRLDGRPADDAGPRPSKEAFLHLAMLRARADRGEDAVVHTHSTHAAAVSCLTDLDPADAVPSLTAYAAMRVGVVPLLPYHAPGDERLGSHVSAAAREHHAVLLSNHGPVASGRGLGQALEVAEEIEETARIQLLLRGLPARALSADERAALRSR